MPLQTYFDEYLRQTQHVSLMNIKLYVHVYTLYMYINLEMLSFLYTVTRNYTRSNHENKVKLATYFQYSVEDIIIAILYLDEKITAFIFSIFK